MELAIAETQVCRTCGATKPIEEFDFRTTRGKHSTQCKVCRRTEQRERWRSLHPPKVRIPRLVGAAEAFVCTRCGELKASAEFAPRRRGQPQLHAWCRACFAELGAKHYVANRERELQRLQRNLEATKAANRMAALEYLRTHPCVRCGESDPIVLEFDHLGKKRADVSRLISSGVTWSQIQREIEQCRILCANCHRVVTGQRAAIGATALQLRLLVPALPAINESPGDPPAAAGTRVCIKCGVDKPLNEFAFRSRAKGTRRSVCRSCQRAYHKEWYRRSRPEQIRRLRRNRRRRKVSRREVQLLVWQYLVQHPCVDCGETDARVLEFDHVRGMKKTEVGALVRAGASWRTVADEIAKCDVRCANCHRRRTASSLGHYRSRATTA